MEPQQKLPPTLGEYLRWWGIVEVALLTGTALYCWLNPPFTLTAYANALFILGAVVMGIGAAMSMGSGSYLGNLTTHYVETTSPVSMEDRLRNRWLDHHRSVSWTVRLVLVGGVPLLVSIAITLLGMRAGI